MAETAYDNRDRVVIGDELLEIEASNLACSIYARQFRGTDMASEPFHGSLVQDISTEYLANKAAHVAMPEWDPDLVHVMGAIWAMARAAGSTDKGWEEFRDWVLSSSMDPTEQVGAVGVLFDDLGVRTFFRHALGAGGDGAPDQVVGREGGKPDGRGGGVA